MILSSLIYLAHSYRPRDAMVNAYFARLIESEGLVPSLDPPSTDVNSAKLERHLGHSDAMIAILTERETGVSPHILYEIALGVRSQKPLLVFVEDTLPSTILPTRILQRRFSYRSFPRNTRITNKVLRFCVTTSVIRHQIIKACLLPRTCLLLGGSTMSDSMLDKIQTYIEKEQEI